MRFLSEIVSLPQVGDAEQFVAAHPHPLLLARIAGTDMPRKFTNKESVAQTRKMAVFKPSLPNPEATVIYAVEKSTRNAERNVICGRALTADVIVNHDSISKHHAAFIAHAGAGWHLTDLGSRNGTMVDDERLGKGIVHPLGDHAEISLGECVFSFYSASALHALLMELRSLRA